MRKLNGGLTVFWLLNFPPVLVLYAIFTNDQFQTFCLLYLALVSIWANVAASLASYIAARVAEKQKEGEE